MQVKETVRCVTPFFNMGINVLVTEMTGTNFLLLLLIKYNGVIQNKLFLDQKVL